MPRDGGKKRGRKIRVDLRKNREKTRRDKTVWTRGFRDDRPEVEDAAQVESVRAKGELSRKRTVIIDDPTDASLWRNGLAVRVRGLIVEVDDGQSLWACTVRRMLRTRLSQERQLITVGDRVKFVPVMSGDEASRLVSDERELPEGVIEDVAPRTTTLTRHYDRRLQVVAANVDTAVIVVAADQPTLRPHLVDRYLVAVHVGDMRPVIVINKADLDADGAAARVSERYRGIGYACLLTCSRDGRGLNELRDALRDRTSVLVGPSGAGKSSLLNALDSNLQLAVGSLSDLQRGRHTTTTAALLKWAFGGYVVDTPGMRQFDLAEMEPSAIEAYFKEFVELVPQCAFPDCSHRHESGCAVIAAVEDGRVSAERYDSYRKMYEECEEKRRTRYD